MTTLRGLPVHTNRSEETVALLDMAREAFADEHDRCVYCGDPWSDHFTRLAKNSNGGREILSVVCCECPGTDGSICWQRPGLE